MRAGGSGDSLGCGKGNTETLELDDTLWGRGAGGLNPGEWPEE